MDANLEEAATILNTPKVKRCLELHCQWLNQPSYQQFYWYLVVCGSYPFPII